jgi:putative membrane protein
MSPEVHLGYDWGAISIPATVALSGVVLVYLRGMYRFRRTRSNVLPSWRLAAFVSGVFSLWVAVGSPLAVLDHQLLTAHMIQHLLLMTVAAPLILLGTPLKTLLHDIPHTHPVFCWLVATTTVIGWHVPVLFRIGMQSERWHAAQHASFFVAGLLFWWPVVRPWPSLADKPQWFVPLYLFLATLPCDALSAFLTFFNRVVYPHYLSVHPRFGFLPLADQALAGALMWVWVTFVYLVPAAVVTVRVLSPQRHALNAELV